MSDDVTSSRNRLAVSWAEMRFNWLLWAATILLAALSTQFFGVLSTLLLCVLGGLAYCCVCFLCFIGEAYKWRIKVDKCYETLFQVQTLLNSSSSERGSTRLAVSDGSKFVHVQVSKPCHKEAQKFIELIMQNFVYEWYRDVTNDVEFPEDIANVLEHVALETNMRVQRIDVDKLVCELLALILPYLEVLNEIGVVYYKGQVVFDVEHEKCLRAFESNHRVAHRALRSQESELRYYRQALDTLVQCAVPPEYRNCDIACTFVRELLLKNIIEPLIDLLCDPDFLIEAIPIVLEKASPEKVRRDLVDIERENEELGKRRHRGRLRMKTMSQRRRFMSLDSQLIQSVQLGSSISSSSHIASVGDFADQGTSGYDLTGASYFGGQLSHSQSSADFLPTRKFPRLSSPPLLPKHPTVDLSSSPRLLPKLYVASASPSQDDFTPPCDYGEDMLSVDLPPIYVTSHVRVESGSAASSYIGYIIKFPKHMLLETDLKDLGVHESETHLEAMKRYSEFIKFYDALRHSPLAIYVKGLELPDKRGFANLVSKLPFTAKDLGITVILERKQGLQKYLQSVSSVKEVARSELFRQFLRSGVRVLKEANIVIPLKPTRRRTLLERMKSRGPSADSAEAMPLPKRPMETVLSSYLNTHLPLPCRSLHSEPDPIHPTATTTRDQPISSQLQSRRSSQSVITPSKVSFSNIASYDNEDEDRVVSEVAVHQLNGAVLVGQTGGDFQAKKDEVGNAADAQVLHIPIEAHIVVPEESQTVGNDSIHPFASASNIASPAPPNCIPTGSISQVNLKSNSPSSDQHSKAGDNQATSIPESNRLSPISSMYSLCKSLSSKLLTKALEIFSFLIYIIRQSLNPLSPQVFIKLAKERQQSMPLSNILLSLGSEASKKNCPELWACNEGTQIAILSLVGGGMERFLWKELHEVVYSDENWTRALYHLRHTLWPGGKLKTSMRDKLSEEKRDDLKKKAAESFKKFLPNFLPYIVGSGDYDRAVHHCIECIQNPRMNRHFLLRVIDVILPKIVPEMQGKDFHRRLVALRTGNVRDVK